MNARARKRRRPAAKNKNRSGNGTAIDFSPFLARLVVSDPRLKLVYFLPHTPQDLMQASPFGFFTPAIHRSAEMIMSACLLPGDVREPFSTPANVMQFRLLRTLWRQVVPIDLDALKRTAASDVPVLFRVVFTNDVGVANAVDALEFVDKIPFLHVSSIEGRGRLPSEKLTTASILEFVESVIRHLSQLPMWQEFVAWLREAMPTQQRFMGRSLKVPVSLHNVTLPNEIALMSFGGILKTVDALAPTQISEGARDPQRYIGRICQLADAVHDERARIMRAGKLPSSLKDWEYIVSVPSVHWTHYRSPSAGSVRETSDLHRAFRIAYKACVRQESYFDSYELEDQRTTAQLFESPAFRSVIQLRSADQRCYTAALSLLASATHAPVLRLEPKLNRIRGDLKMLAISARAQAGGDPQLKQSRLLRGIGAKMRSLVDKAYLRRIEQKTDGGRIAGLKLVADLPLEWLPLSGVPLMLRYDVSRIPVLPGNILIQQCAHPPILTSAAAFKDVLVVRSFAPDDRLKPVLEQSFKQAYARLDVQPPQVRFVDVNSEDAFADALQTYHGTVVIFDGHGGYEDKFGVGTIVVGGKSVDVWTLRERCRFPPIVIFSACDTHPVDGSHGSVANAAFALGAVTVLATLLPVNAMTAAALIARLLLRMVEFIKVAADSRAILTWREVISGMTRMAYTAEVRHLLTGRAGLRLRDGGHDRVQMVANTAINARRADWFDCFIGAISVETSIAVEDIRGLISRWASITDALKYVQLGSPENIVIWPEAGAEEMQKAAMHSRDVTEALVVSKEGVGE